MNVAGKATWATAAYIATVRTMQRGAAGERGRQRRSGVLQRILYWEFCTELAVNHAGVNSKVGCRVVRTFLRLLLYLCDQQEERAILCLGSGACYSRSSTCDYKGLKLSSPAVFDAWDRDASGTLQRQLEPYSML